MNINLEQLIKHPIKTLATAGAGIILLTNIAKAQDSLNGKITDPLTGQGLEGKKITLNLYNPVTHEPIGTTSPVWTDINGYYMFNNITDVDDGQTPTSKSIIQYIGNKIFTNNFNEKTLKIYNEIGQEIRNIKTTNPEINLNLEGLASGRYITILELDKKAYANIIIQDAGQIIGQKKLEETITEETKKQTNKITEIEAGIDILNETNTHHSYINGPVGIWNGQKTLDITLPPIIQLQTQFTDPEVPYPINNIMDLWKYMSRIQGQDDYRIYAKTLWPIKIYIDTTNAPTEWITPIRNAINFKRNNTTNNPDSLLQETNEYTDPFSGQNFSAISIIYTDSLDIGQQDSRIGFFYDSNTEAFTGAYFKINTSTGQQPIDIYKAIQRNIQKYVTQSLMKINNSDYMGTETRGPPYETTPDEQLLEDMVRNMSPEVWINRFFNPGALNKQGNIYTPETPEGYKKQGHLLVPKEDIITKENKEMYKQMRRELEQK
ncbi:MAG: hypothetical protein ACP5NV_00625 [Candidatus Woesearchaeota archaeon]